MLSLLLLACAPEALPEGAPTPKLALPPETDLRVAPEARFPFAEGLTLELSDQALHLRGPDLRELVRIEVVGLPAVAGDRAVLSYRGGDALVSTLETLEWQAPTLRQVVITKDGAPDRVAISEDGEWIAWVSGASGVASVYAAPFEGAPITQLTNVDLAHVPGQAPEGFVPPPHQGPLRIEGHRVVWDSPEGPQEVPLP
ncbi:MAG: hypothetical protein H6740_13370 [Alphaproteobacteria bacterium]|nr:hypothetical protein [Alphaproteobacteria bacterium]